MGQKSDCAIPPSQSLGTTYIHEIRRDNRNQVGRGGGGWGGLSGGGWGGADTEEQLGVGQC